MNLTETQTHAVQRTGQDVCVVAGPGSGKTRVLVERFCWLVTEKLISPLRILAITFTEKAATEIKQRLVETFAGRPELREQIERAYVSTVHGFCARLLRENPIAAGLDPEFIVMDEPQSQAELAEAAHQALDALFEEKPAEFRNLLEALDVSTQEGGRQPDLATALLDVYEAMRIAGRTPSDVRQQAAGTDAAEPLSAVLRELGDLLDQVPAGLSEAQSRRVESLREWADRASSLTGSPPCPSHFDVLEEFPRQLPRLTVSDRLKQIRDERIPTVKAALIGEYHAPLRSLLLEALTRIDNNYRRRKHELSALDFSDLEERAIDLLNRNPRVRAAVRNNFDQILMDELQDTNRLQWRLLNLVRSADQFFAVGDINQSIYGFRHADPEVFREYRDRISGEGKPIDELYDNHRSREHILSAVELVLNGAAGIEPHHLTAKRPFGEKSEPSVEVIAGYGDTTEEAARVEAQWVARRVRELTGTLVIQDRDGQRPARSKDVAILLRTTSALGPIERAFRDFRIPYLTAGGRTFYETREVRDLMHLLRVVANPRDEIALACVLRSPLVGVGDETLLRLKQASNLADALRRLDRMDTSAFDPDDLHRLRRFRDRLSRMRAERDDVSPDKLLVCAIDHSGYEEGLDSRARANVDKFLALVRGWFRRRPRSIDELVDDLEWLRASASETDAPPDDSSDVVRLMTIHQAKGLQFPIVFLPALHKGVNRRRPPVCLSPQGALGVRWRNPATGEALADLAHCHYVREMERKEEAEEDRLLYVAMTRAEEHLVLSFAKAKRPGSAWWKKVASGLSVDLETTDDFPVHHMPGTSPVPVRLLRTGLSPELLAAPAGVLEEQEERLFLPRPLLSDQHDSTASVTSIMTFALCPRRYYLGRYLGWPDSGRAAFRPEPEEAMEEKEELGEPDASEFGRQVHALLAGVTSEGASPEALQLVSRFQLSELGQRAARAKGVEREFDFVMAFEDVVLRGQIDLWFEEGGELVLVDYKTDDVEPETVWERGQSYALQLRLYALALERLAGKLPNQALVYLLRPNRAVPIDLGAAVISEARDSVRAFREAQSNMQFDLREGEHCRRCPFLRGLCPAGKRRSATARAKPSSFPAPS